MITIFALKILACFLLCGIVGFFIGQWYESEHGFTQKERLRYRQMVMRMIPKLKKHYTGSFIYWGLIRNEHKSD